MPVRGVSHVAVGVRDMDAALPFYRDVLGLRVAFDGIEEFGDPAKGAVTRRRAVYLRHPDGDGEDAAFLVLDQQLSRDPWGDPARLFQIGLHHFGFWVDDIEAIAQRATDGGVTVIRPPSDGDTAAYGEPAGGVIRTMFLQDPDGNVVQCDQRVRAHP